MTKPFREFGLSDNDHIRVSGYLDISGYIRLPHYSFGICGLIFQPIQNMIILKQTRPTVDYRHPEIFKGSIFTRIRAMTKRFGGFPCLYRGGCSNIIINTFYIEWGYQNILFDKQLHNLWAIGWLALFEASFTTAFYPSIMIRTVLATDLKYKYPEFTDFYPKLFKQKGIQACYRGLYLHFLYKMVYRYTLCSLLLNFSLSKKDFRNHYRKSKSFEELTRTRITVFLPKHCLAIFLAEFISYPIQVVWRNRMMENFTTFGYKNSLKQTILQIYKRGGGTVLPFYAGFGLNLLQQTGLLMYFILLYCKSVIDLVEDKYK